MARTFVPSTLFALCAFCKIYALSQKKSSLKRKKEKEEGFGWVGFPSFGYQFWRRFEGITSLNFVNNLPKWKSWKKNNMFSIIPLPSRSLFSLNKQWRIPDYSFPSLPLPSLSVLKPHVNTKTLQMTSE